MPSASSQQYTSSTTTLVTTVAVTSYWTETSTTAKVSPCASCSGGTSSYQNPTTLQVLLGCPPLLGCAYINGSCNVFPVSVELQAGDHLVVPITMTQTISVYVMDGATYNTWNQRGVCAPPSTVIKAASNIAGQYRVDFIAPKSGTYYIVLLNYDTAQVAGFATVSLDVSNLITTNTITNSAVQYSTYTLTGIASSLQTTETALSQTEQTGQAFSLSAEQLYGVLAATFAVLFMVTLAVLIRQKRIKKRRR